MTRKQMMVLAALGSAALLAGAFVFQMLGYAPCKLCIAQRWPHGGAVVVGVVAIFFAPRVLAYLGAALAAMTAGYGFYHAGVEKGIFEGPNTCTSNDISAMDAGQLMDQILNAPLIRCDEIAWSLMGVSMAGWNAILSSALVIIWLLAARKA